MVLIISQQIHYHNNCSIHFGYVGKESFFIGYERRKIFGKTFFCAEPWMDLNKHEKKIYAAASVENDH